MIPALFVFPAGFDLPSMVRTSEIYFALTALIVCAEAAAGRSVRRYFGAGHLRQFIWYFFQNSSLRAVILTSWVYYLLHHYLGFLNLRLLVGKPWMVRFAIVMLTTDFLYYWIHRMAHAAPFLWAFHAMHHSPEKLTPAQLAQTHPVDDYPYVIVVGTLQMIIGTEPPMWTTVTLIRTFVSLILHSELNWRFGPLYYIFVSPAFHRVHHGKAEEFHDRNFGQVLSVWDFLFRTAYDPAVAPREYGLIGVAMPTITSQVFEPFRTVYRHYFGNARAGVDLLAGEIEPDGQAPL